MKIKKILLLLLVIATTLPVMAEGRRVVIDKPNLRLYVIDGSDTIFNVRVCCGINYGNKQGYKDFRTPEGNFKVYKIQDSRKWLHQNRNGSWSADCYGPWYVRLATPGWTGIGIHGTKAPSSIGHRRSEGCIRMLNANIERFVKLIDEGTPVTILPDKKQPAPKKETAKTETPKAETAKAEN